MKALTEHKVRTLRTVTLDQVSQIEWGIFTLKQARSMLRKAGAKQAAKYVARSIKSAEGAQRHALRALREAERQAGI